MSFEVTLDLKDKPAIQFKDVDDVFDGINCVSMKRDNVMWMYPFHAVNMVMITENENTDS